MKTSFTTKAAAALALMMVSSASMAAIANTRHNLGSSGNWNTASNTTEICVFCHTPHGANTTANAPLWNRNVGTAGTYTTYGSLGSASLDTKQAPIGSVSLACLSCHDGTQAVNVVINTPGSNTTGNILDGTNDPRNIASGSMKEFEAMSEVHNGAGPGTEMIYLSTDLRNDHPISIQYAGALQSGRGAIDPDFASASVAQVNGQDFWYVDSSAGSGSGYQKQDFKLYSRSESVAIGLNGAETAMATTTAQPFVECATCHDPHVEAKTFLRMGTNDNSQVCLTCHTK